MHIKNIKYLLAVIILTAMTCLTLAAQNPRRGRRARGTDISALQVNPDSLRLKPVDSLDLARQDSIKFRKDSIAQADSLARRDSLDLLSKSSLTLPAFSGARDSIVEDFSQGRRKIYYYGDVTVNYQDMKLTAEYMEYDMTKGEVFACGVYDSLSGEWKGQPVMEQGGAQYSMEKLRYNFNTRKSFITNMSTTEQDGILHGKNIKMMPDRSINISHGRYTVCDCEEPHYYMSLSSAKVVPGPGGNTTIFGPAGLVIEGVHLPIGLPFGFVPKKPQRSTGLLMPTFGEETKRGFYMRDAGMYFVFGNYLDLSVTGDYYTLGSWALNVNSRYRVNYKFNGGFGMTISNDQAGEKGSPDFFQSRNFSLKWNHSQDAKARPGTSFSASVNFSSPSNSRFNSQSVQEALQNQISSSVSFSKNWNGKMNLSVNALHNQNSRDSSYAFTLPNVTFSVSTFYPFKKKNRVGKEKFYEKISFGYNTSLQNKVNFKMSEFQNTVIDERTGQPVIDALTGKPMKEFDMNKMLNTLPGKFQNGMSHNFSIGLPQFQLLKYINVNPSVSYGMNWFFKKTEYAYSEEEQKVVQLESHNFNHFGITQSYSGSVSASTRIYGMFNFGKHRRIQAIRHVVSPSFSLSYRPELGTYANGWREFQYIDKDGKEMTHSYNIYAGQLNSAPGKGQSASCSFSVGNNLEAKVRNLADTTGNGTKKIKLIDQLNFSSGYNFLADSMKLNTVNMSMSTSIFEKISISASASLDPYAIDEKGKRYNTFNVVKEGWAHPFRVTNASASLSYSLTGKGTMNGNDGTKGGSGGGAKGGANDYKRIYYHPVTGEFIPGGWLYYTNPNAPWSVSLSYSLSYSRNYQFTNNQLIPKNNINQTVSVNGNLKLTPKLSLTGNTGFDFMAGKVTTSQISATYDLHCFNISVSWVPTGQWQSYSFRIAANAAALADILRFKKSSSYWDN